MKNLFKETLRSLSKNKVTITGLTILVFLSSSVFTFTSDITKSMTDEYNERLKISKLHDLTLDLNIPSNGSAYNNGYYINGNDQNSVIIPTDYNEPIRYFDSTNYLKVEYGVSLLNEDNDYINLSIFKELSEQYKNLYLKKDDLSKFFNVFYNNKTQNKVLFDINENSKTILFNDEYNFDLFYKQNNNFELVTKTQKINSDSNIYLDKIYTLNDIAKIIVKDDNSLIASEFSTLFININTFEATFDFIKGKKWDNLNQAYKVETKELTSFLGFVEFNNSDHIFTSNLTKLINRGVYSNTDENKIKNFIINNSILFGDLNKNSISEFKQQILFSFPQNIKFNLPNQWVTKNNIYSYFNRWNYTITYDEVNREKWTGDYKTYIEDQINKNNLEIPKDLRDFSFWQKKDEILTDFFDENGNYIKTIKTSDLTSKISKEDLELDLIIAPKDSQNQSIDYKKFNYSGTKTIKQIENISEEKIYDELIGINNQNIKDDTFNRIKNGSLVITKKRLITKVGDIVKESNIGYRQTLTVDAVDEKTNQKNSFNFINIGDKNNVVNGVELNVGKLYNEFYQKTSINFINEGQNKFFKSKQLPVYVSGLLIKYLNQGFNIDPDYVIVDNEIGDIEIFNPNNGDLKKINAKVFKFSNFDKEEIDINKFNEYGFASDSNKIIVVKQNKVNDEIIWKNVVFNNHNSIYWNDNDIIDLMISQNWTLKTSYINPNGWAKSDNSFKNTMSLPLGYVVPNADIVDEALNKQTLNIFIDSIEKVLLDSDLVRQGYISKESMSVFMESLKKALNENDLYKLFTGKASTETLPKTIFSLIYNLTQTKNGDYLSVIINGIFNNIKLKINNFNTVNEQKEYLTKQIQNLYEFVNKFFGLNFEKYFSPSELVNLSKDPKIVLDCLSNIILSFDFKTFTSKIMDFYNSGEHNKTINIDNEELQIKLSSSQIIVYLLESLNQTTVKNSLVNILNNLDENMFVNKENNIFLNRILDLLPENIKTIVKSVFSETRIFDPENTEKFNNFKLMIAQILEIFDFNIFSSELRKSLNIYKITDELVTYNKSLEEYQTTKRNYAIYSFKTSDILKSSLKALFSIPGSNKLIKNLIIEGLNISSKNTVINIDENNKLLIPSADNEKLDFFDLIKIFNSGSFDSVKLRNFEKDVVIFEKIPNNFNSIKDLNYLEKEFLEKYNVTNKDEFNEFSKKFNQVIQMIKLDRNKVNFSSEMNVANLSRYLVNYNFGLGIDHEDSNTYWTIISGLLNKIIPYNATTEFSYGLDGLNLFKLWFEIFILDENIYSKNEKIRFANNLLSFANKREIIEYFNDKKLLNPTLSNIPLPESADFAVSRSIVDLNGMIELFFKEENGTLTNVDLNNFVNNNVKFKSFILENKKEITRMFSYIASSDKYYRQNGEALLTQIIRNLINGDLIKDELYNNKDIFKIIFENEETTEITTLFGINSILLDPILRNLTPELLIWLFTENSNSEINQDSLGNLAWFIQNKIINFEELVKFDSDAFSLLFKNEKPLNTLIEHESEIDLIIDNTLNIKMSEFIGQFIFFDIDITKLFLDTLNSITIETYDENVIKFNDTSSYVAKVNYSFLINNNKAIYEGKIPDTPTEIERLINKLDSKFLIDVNGIKFIIIGEDITADYLYPVIDENNIQVDTKNQALIYVNENGFDRVRFAYQGNVVKEYLLIKTPEEMKTSELKEQVTNIVNNNLESKNTAIKRVYEATETDPINPERALRVSILSGLISSIQNVSNIILTVLLVLVSTSIVFIIRRYINNKNKVIGILVAQGYSTLQLSISFTVFAMFTALIGGISGYIIGFILQEPIGKIFSSYWTLPPSPYKFSFLSFALTIIVPFIGMSILIVLISLISLRYKAIDLMSGITEIKIGQKQKKFQRLLKKNNVKVRFSGSLLFNSFWKLMSFALSIILTGITVIFGLSTFNVFDKSIQKTYQNRHYKFKYDLETPTTQGGAIHPFNIDDLDKSIYVPLGEGVELKRNYADYFRPGYSSIINYGGKNGDPDEFTSHILSQFSVNIKVDSGIAADPWSIAYNSMPDSQKSRINLIRDKIGKELELTQEGLVINDEGQVDFEKTTKELNFFHYIPNKTVITDSKFMYYEWNNKTKEYDIKQITTKNLREEYREFLVNAYNKIKEKELEDFLISFGGIYFDEKYDEKYTYVSSEINSESIKLYGYDQNSKLVKITNSSGDDLIEKLNNFEDARYIPLVINHVSSKKFNLGIDTIIELNVLNHIDRYTYKINEFANSNYSKPSTTYKFKVIGISETYINQEFVVSKKDADRITGLDKIKFRYDQPFNGILSSSDKATQILGSTSLYSPSGYWAGLSTYDVNNLDLKEKQEIYDNLFGEKGVMISAGNSKEDVAMFLSAGSSNNYETVFNNLRSNPETSIDKYSAIFDGWLYMSTASSLESKDIEVSFTKSISSNMESLSTIIISLGLIITMTIIVIISHILINENKKNIAIWSILGYSQKEKIVMFFSIFIPFIIISTLIAIPFSLIIINIFSNLLIQIAAIAVPIKLGIMQVIYTLVIIFGVFAITTFASWKHINSIKPVELLKGK